MLQTRSGARVSRSVTFTHISPVWRAGAPSRIAAAASAVAAAAARLSGELPLGSPTSPSSAIWVTALRTLPVSRSLAVTRSGKLGGRAPTIPATPLGPSEVIVPTSLPGEASL